jgi:uncharacterized protein YjbI with pentapeptide repeats
LAKCRFAIKYWNYESQAEIDYFCEEDSQGNSDKCIFHDVYYLQHPLLSFREEKKSNVIRKLMDKTTVSIALNKALVCIGYYLSDVTIRGNFTKPVYFNGCRFQSRADFRSAKFSVADFRSAKFSESSDFRSAELSIAWFDSAKFSRKADFTGAKFSVADFGSAEFSNIAIFRSAEFSNIANFGLTIFSGKANFASTIFPATPTKFFGEANFYSAKFFGEAIFGSAEFSDLVDFGSAEFSDLANFYSAKFSKAVTFRSAEFSKAKFYSAKFVGSADFISAKFVGSADFISVELSLAWFGSAKFSAEADFSGICIKDRAYFNYVLFEDGRKILFGIDDLSRVSFMNTDITRVRFNDRARWGKGQDKFKVFEEKLLETSLSYCEPLEYVLNNFKDSIKEDENRKIRFHDIKNLLQIEVCNAEATVRNMNDNKVEFFVIKRNKRNHVQVYPSKLEFTLGTVMAFYRNLRENYEFRLRYDDAGKLFFREMELKRKYIEKEVNSGEERSVLIKRNDWFRRNVSLTGLYYHFSKYGEGILRPTIIGIIIVGLSTLWWLFQNTSLDKAFERSLGDFLPTLSLASNINVSIIDYVVKIVGGALTFVLLAVALRVM